MSQQLLTNCNSLGRLAAVFTVVLVVAITAGPAHASSQIDVDEDLKHLLARCHRDPARADDYNDCMKQVFNDLRAYFTTGKQRLNVQPKHFVEYATAIFIGVPDYNIKPFDPHRAAFVELRRGDPHGPGSFKLILRNVSEYGWSRSEVTKFHSDAEDQRIVYAQYFPEKSLEGQYDFAAKVLGKELRRQGHWNLTLYDYRC